MARVTAEEVLDIMDSDCVVSSIALTAMITAANTIITKVFKTNTDVTDAELKELERWLSAHIVASTLYRMATMERVGDAEVKYMGSFGQQLDSTPYGQMVKLLDTTGELAKAGKLAVSFYAVPNFDE